MRQASEDDSEDCDFEDGCVLSHKSDPPVDWYVHYAHVRAYCSLSPTNSPPSVQKVSAYYIMPNHSFTLSRKKTRIFAKIENLK